MSDRYYIVKVSSADPFAPVPGNANVMEYHFPTERKAQKFVSESIGQGHWATIFERLLTPEEMNNGCD